MLEEGGLTAARPDPAPRAGLRESAELLASVVVPVRNGGDGLRELIDALAGQTLPRDRFEVLVADDGSTDGAAQSIPVDDAWLRVLPGPPQNSYAARNRAARAARSPVLAFCDADCVPAPTWLEAGLGALEHADIVAGRVRFQLPRRPTVWSRLDADMHLNQEKLVATGAGATANLLMRRTVFEELGGFDESLPMGGDVELPREAVRGGARLVYAPEAVVAHPTRDGAASVLSKVWRIHRCMAVRRSRADELPDVLTPRSLLPVLGPLITRRRRGLPLVGPSRADAQAGDRPRRHAVALVVLRYLVVPYVAGAAQLRGWWEGRRLRDAPR